LTALVWGWALCCIIDRRLGAAAGILGAAGVAALFGVIHSPLPSGALFWPWSAGATPFEIAAGYGLAGAVLLFFAGREPAGERAAAPSP
jgi:AGZA family xanthine/uracil permease-like MFS transporter